MIDFGTIFNESRALPGGMLNSKEHTEYEDWHENLLKEIDKKKQEKDSCPMVLFDSEAGANGYHNNDGTLIEKKEDEKEKIFKTCYYENLGLGSLYRVLEELETIANLKFKFEESENGDTGRMEAELDRHIDFLVKYIKEIDFITNKESDVLAENKTKNWIESFEEMCLKIIDVVDSTIRNSTIPMGKKRNIIEHANDALDVAGMEAINTLSKNDYLSSIKYHRNGKSFDLANYRDHKTIRNLFVKNGSSVKIA